MSIILLDIGNVIVNVDFFRFCNAVSGSGQSGAQEMFQRYCTSDLKNRFDKGAISPFDYLGMISADPEARPMPVWDIREIWQDIFTPMPESADAVRRIRNDHSLWIMSDTDPLHFTFLLNHYPVLKEAERFWLSFEHGYLKREPESFHEVLACSGMDAREFVLIDDREENCRCAEAAGIRTHLFLDWSGTIETLAAM